jgi:Hint domain
MASSTISTHVYHGVTFDNATYFSPLTVLSTGIVAPVDGNAVYASFGYGAASIVNQGMITGGGGGGSGIKLNDGGTVDNQGGRITGSYYGIYFGHAAASITNTGTIIGTDRDGVAVGPGSFGVNIDNSGTAALIAGKNYGIFDFGAGTVGNDGTITASGFIAAVGFAMGGSINNRGTAALIESYYGVRIGGVATITNAGMIIGTVKAGVYLHDGGTITNSGTISGAGGTAINFLGTGNDRLVLEHGYSLGGGVSVAGTANVVELLGTYGAVTLDFNKVGAGFTQFGTFAFGAPSGNDTTLKISDTLAAPGTITSFNAPHDIVDLTQIDPTGAVVRFDTISNIMTISNSSQSATLRLDAEDYSTVRWLPTPDGGGGTDVVVVCYCHGTRILTPDGEVPIEDLMIGEHVITHLGETRPIKWIGHRRIDLSKHARPETAAPIRIERDAFADDVPHRDLLISPDHAIFVDGELICARQLVNGTTIVRETGLASVDYYHVELNEHAILLAEGLPAESYLDTGNRGFFSNGGAPLVLHPNLMEEGDHPTREAGSCAPFVSDEAGARAAWQRLADRAATLGRPVTPPEVTRDAGLRVIANGRALRPVHEDGGRFSFALPNATTEIRLVSRSAPPTVARPWTDDRRRLGVCVTRITVRAGRKVADVPLDGPALRRGWWEVERDGDALRRWTDGDAVLRLPATVGPALLEVRADTLPYPMTEARAA